MDWNGTGPGIFKKKRMTTRAYLRTFSILHYSIFAGILLLAFYIFSLDSNATLDLSPKNDIFFYIVPALAVLGFIGSNFIFKTYLNSLTINNSLKDNLSGYQSASLIKYALIEAPAFLAIIMFMNEGNLYYMIIAGVLIAYFFILRPSKEKIINHLNLNMEDRVQFNKDNEMLL